jgi:hypothetical protein
VLTVTTLTTSSQIGCVDSTPTRQQVMPDDHSESVPPLPIPNRTVKRLHADDSADARVKVGNRQAPLLIEKSISPNPIGWGFLLCGAGKIALRSSDRSIHSVIQPNHRFKQLGTTVFSRNSTREERVQIDGDDQLSPRQRAACLRSTMCLPRTRCAVQRLHRGISCSSSAPTAGLAGCLIGSARLQRDQRVRLPEYVPSDITGH